MNQIDAEPFGNEQQRALRRAGVRRSSQEEKSAVIVSTPSDARGEDGAGGLKRGGCQRQSNVIRQERKPAAQSSGAPLSAR
ncbi:MAG: hypothetical protein ACLS7Z_07395 [Christensenellales bacterium]